MTQGMFSTPHRRIMFKRENPPLPLLCSGQHSLVGKLLVMERLHSAGSLAAGWPQSLPRASGSPQEQNP